MTRLALQRRLAAALPVAGIVGVLVALFLASDDGAVRAPGEAGRAIVAIPRALPSPAAASGADAMASTRVSPETGRSEVQICGGAWVPADENGAPEPAAMLALVERLGGDTERAALARLESSPDRRDRATALRLRVMQSQELADGRVVLNAEGRVAQEALVSLALAGRDPEPYGAALATCERVSAIGAAADAASARCPLVSAAQWAALDPDNAVPWLARAEEARRANDRFGEDEALWRAVRAPRFESSFGPFVSRVLADGKDDGAAAWGTFGFAVAAMGRFVAQQPDAGWLQSCSVAAMADAWRRDLCDAVAERLVDQADTLIDRSMGAALGRRLGWPQEKLDTIARDRDALVAAYVAPEAQAAPADCKALARDIERLREIGRHGEIGALRRAVAARTAAASALPAR